MKKMYALFSISSYNNGNYTLVGRLTEEEALKIEIPQSSIFTKFYIGEADDSSIPITETQWFIPSTDETVIEYQNNFPMFKNKNS